MRRLHLVLLLVVLAPVSGCGGTTAGGTANRAGTAAAGSWTTYGGSASRASVAPGVRTSPRLQRRFSRSVDGEVYAQPLISGDRIHVATENNSVYAFTTGGKLVWRRDLGAPVPSSDLPCGNISPSGITGTSVIAAGASSRSRSCARATPTCSSASTWRAAASLCAQTPMLPDRLAAAQAAAFRSSPATASSR
jgi:hypothetical protein